MRWITTGFGRLRHLGIRDMDVSLAIKALDALDRWMDERYRWILEHSNKDEMLGRIGRARTSVLLIIP